MFKHFFTPKREPETVYPAHYLDCEFDIENINVVSIERQKGFAPFRGEETVIGYTTYGKTIHSWYVWCSPEKHNQFVRRLRLKLELRLAPAEDTLFYEA